MNRHIIFIILLAGLLLSSLAANCFAVDVTVQGLYKDGAILMIDGKQRTLRAGKRSPEGVLLISADTQQAVLEIDGKQHTMGLSRVISSEFKEPEKATVRIASGRGGHYMTPGRINGFPVEFMVDTGATSIAINLPTAQALGINYRAGTQINVSTASGMATGYQVLLDSVRVGDVEVNKVYAIISMSDFPQTILLGNSFLNRVELRREGGVLVLESRY